jgi:exopolysaccharide biosynthesis protein
MIVAIYFVLSKQEPYKAPKPKESTLKTKKQINSYLKQLQKLGIEEHLIEKIQQESRFFTEAQTNSFMKLTPPTQWE